MQKMCPLLLFAALSPLFLAAQTEPRRTGFDGTSAQAEQLLNDPDVIWAAKIEFDWIPEPDWAFPDEARRSDTTLANTSTVLKMLHQGPHPADLGHDLLGWKIYEAIRNGWLPVYDSPEATQPLSKKEVGRRLFEQSDTIVTFDPVTYEEGVYVTNGTFDAESLRYIRVQQWLFFRKSTGEFDVYTAAWQPVFARWYYYYLPNFWVKMPPYRRKKAPKLDLNSRHVTWARRLKAVNNGVRPDSLRAAKDFAPPVMQRFLDRVTADPKWVLHSGYDWLVIEEPERSRLLKTRLDTVETFDPETYEIKQAVNETTYDSRNIPELRLMQDWWWDEQAHQLQFSLFAFAPTLFTDEYPPKYYRPALRPLFWRECSRGKKQSQKNLPQPLATYQPVRIFAP